MGFSNIFIVFRNYNKKSEEGELQKKVSETWVYSNLFFGYFYSFI
jgi:hypothetical protein